MKQVFHNLNVPKNVMKSDERRGACVSFISCGRCDDEEAWWVLCGGAAATPPSGGGRGPNRRLLGGVCLPVSTVNSQ